MKTLYYEQMNGIYTDQILQDVDIHKPERVVIFGQTEWEIRPLTREFVSSLKSKNVELHVVHGAGYHETYQKKYDDIGLPIDNVTFWPTFWLKYTYISLYYSGLRAEEYVVDHRKLKHRFISLNNRSHVHRCAFIDEMAKENLIDKGIVTWVKHLNENSNYPYKHFDNRQILLDDDFVNKLDSFLLPKEYHESCVHVITESTDTINIISEKTWIPLLLKKPFLVLAGKGFNKELTSLGFKLYDNIFDYSFDDVDDLHERTELFVKNLHRLQYHDPSILYKIMWETTEYNYKHAVDLIKDNSTIPDVVMEFYNLHDHMSVRNSNLATTVTHFHNIKPKELKLFSIWQDNPNYLEEVVGSEVYEVIVDNTPEVAYNQLQCDVNGLEKLIVKCKEENVPLTLLSCCYKHNHYIDKELSSYMNVIEDDAFWISKHLQAMISNHETCNTNKLLGHDVYDKHAGLATDIQHLYITTNNLAKYHRCQMMDMLAKYNLIDRGAIAWRNSVRGIEEDDPNIFNEVFYKYKHWTPRRMYLDFEDNKTSFVNQNVLPSQYKHSFMQLVAESEDEHFMLSEKTAIPLLMNKPFLVVSCKDFHKKLADIGFQLYDELFDYSFDSVDDLAERTELIVKNVYKLSNKTVDQLNELTELVKPKLEHNRKIALECVDKTIELFRPYLNKIESNGIKTQLKLLETLEHERHKFYQI